VFQAEVFLVDVSALGQPGFELAGGFDDVHWGNDSGGENGKSNGEAPNALARETTRNAELVASGVSGLLKPSTNVSQQLQNI